MKNRYTDNNRISFLGGRKAVIINFTADSYHWGCYGTSMEIYHTLLESNYYIDTISVNAVHSISPSIEKADDFNSDSFFTTYCNANLEMCRTLQTADLIVVNGEGTLHRMNKAPLNLLYLMLICKKYFQKPVLLINFSCFPNGDASALEKQTMLYPQILKHMDQVTARESMSFNLLQNAGVKAQLGFDCLPRFLKRHKLTNTHTPEGHVLISGGVSLAEEDLSFFASLIDLLSQKGIAVRYLTGAKSHPANEDAKFWENLKIRTDTKNVKFVMADTMLDWVDELRTASFLFSARFHHTIAALSIGTPFGHFESNTPKISAALQTLNEPSETVFKNQEGLDALLGQITSAVDCKVTNKCETRVNLMTDLAAKNFILFNEHQKA